MRILKLSLSLAAVLLLFISFTTSFASADYQKLKSPPTNEQWFGIYVDNERVGFYRQKISPIVDGYRIDADGNVRMKIMGFSKEASMRESYTVTKSLGLKSFEVDQTIGGLSSRVSGKVSEGAIRLASEDKGGKKEKTIKIRGEVFPGAVLNILPMMRDTKPGKSYRVNMFDPEELKAKEVKISVVGITRTPDGKQEALQLRNNLYPFVHNDVWMSADGDTLVESVREGLVTTKQEKPEELSSFIGSIAFAKKDLIYDFSLIKVEPPIVAPTTIESMKFEISGWNDNLPLMQSRFQRMEKKAAASLAVEVSRKPSENSETVTVETAQRYLVATEKIEAAAAPIAERSKEIVKDLKSDSEKAAVIARWSADWLSDTVDEGGSALEALKSKHGNCQTHARLYTALARAASIPTKFVSGLVYQEKLGFLYHSWSESLLNGIWTPVDPTFNQLPADVTHIKLFEGERPEDMSPIIAVIGKISIKVLNGLAKN